MRRAACLLLALAVTAVTATARSQVTELEQLRDVAAPKAAATVFDKVVTIGASLTDGFANGLPIAPLLDKAIVTEHRLVERVSTSAFFSMPLRLGAQQVRRARKLEASLVVGVDFLFWYVYGPTSRHLSELRSLPLGDARAREAEERSLADASAEDLPLLARLATLERGLAELEQLEVPIVIGDIPDMTGASPMMLPQRAIPSRAIQDAANTRIRAWARERKDRVLLFPLAERVLSMKLGTMVLAASGDQKALRLPMRVVLCNDKLHPSKIGALLFVDQLVDALAAFRPQHAKALVFDVRKEIAARGLGDVLVGLAAADDATTEAQATKGASKK